MAVVGLATAAEPQKSLSLEVMDHPTGAVLMRTEAEKLSFCAPLISIMC